MLTLKIPVTDDMTVGSLREITNLLREWGHVERRDELRPSHATFLHCTFNPENVVGEIGDVGPEDWARYAFGLPESADLQRDGEGAKMLCAMSLSDWWDELRTSLIALGATDVTHPSEAT